MKKNRSAPPQKTNPIKPNLSPKIELCSILSQARPASGNPPERQTTCLFSSVFVPDKGLALVNLRSSLLDDAGWNTISMKVEVDRVQVWLNAEKIGAVRTAGPTKGRIGLYVSGKGGEL